MPKNNINMLIGMFRMFTKKKFHRRNLVTVKKNLYDTFDIVITGYI